MRALPLALLIAATLVAGIVLAIIRGTEEDGPQVLPTTPPPSPTMTSPPPTTDVSPSPTTPATTDVSPTPTVSPTTDVSPSPTDPSENGDKNGRNGKKNGNGNGNGKNGENGDERVLPETGGPPAPFLLGGAGMVGLAAALWRLSRRPVR